MKRENRALLVLVLAAVVVVAAGGAFIWLANPPLPTTLPIPAGTTFSRNESVTWLAHFNVSGSGAHVVGSWEAFDGYGFVTFVVVNGTTDKPPPWLYRMCPALMSWPTQNGTVDESVGPGAHTAYWSAGFCAGASRIVVTSTIMLAP